MAGADPKNPKNFHPVSLLPYPAKILERQVTHTITNFLEAHSPMHPGQSGLSACQSTELMMLSVLDDLRWHSDNNVAMALILLDLSAAFDTIDHTILLRRMTLMGITGSALARVTFFLGGRTQEVLMGDFTSDTRTLSCGVPQSSAISPLLLNIY